MSEPAVEIRAFNAPWRAAVELLLRDRATGAVATVITFRNLTEEERAVAMPPVARMRIEDAQTLMDDLWLCGLRPTEGTGSAGALAATQRHLDDMRGIAHRLLEVAVPKKPE